MFNLSKFKSSIVIVAMLALVLGGLGIWIAKGVSDASISDDFEIPTFSAVAEEGATAFAENCSTCHGENAVGTEQGPPLIHEIYNPGHHADQAFYRAVARGTPQHHWPYGDMPPVPKVSAETVATIIAFVRELQVANGIHYKKHRM